MIGETIFPLESTDRRSVDIEKEGSRQAVAVAYPALIEAIQENTLVLKKILAVLQISNNLEIRDSDIS